MSTRTIHWTEDTKTMKIRTDIPGFFIEFGNQMVYRVKNNTGQNLSAGKVVFFSGSDDFPTITIADYSNYSTSEGTIGICAHTIPNNTEGYIITSGILRNINLTGYNDGDEVYLYTQGNFTKIKPTAPLPEVYLGTIIKSGEDGILAVNIELGFELEELHNVKIENPQNGQVLTYNQELQVWEPSYVNSLNILVHNFTIELMDSLSVDFYAPFNLKINSISNIKNQPSVNIAVENSSYSLGGTILKGNKITVTASTISVISLNCEKN